MPRPVSNPPNPWSATEVEWLGPPPEARLEVFEERAKSLLSANDSPDVPFRYSANPYRGCTHACAYCYARRSHQFLGLGAGTDFDRKIVVKTNAPELLARELARPSWTREVVAFSGNTDCYQPLEAEYALTRRCLEVSLAHGTPVGVITKSSLVRRDADLLAELAASVGAQVHVSIPFADAVTCRAIEPGTPTPAQRFETLRLLTEAGVPTAVAIAPLIPGLNDHAIPELVERAAEAGARSAFMIRVRLSSEVRAVFEERLREALPERADHVLSALADTDAGSGAFGERMVGRGARWETAQRLFEVACRRHGLLQGEDRRPTGPSSAGSPAPRTGASFRLLRERAQPARRGEVQGHLFDSGS